MANRHRWSAEAWEHVSFNRDGVSAALTACSRLYHHFQAWRRDTWTTKSSTAHAFIIIQDLQHRGPYLFVALIMPYTSRPDFMPWWYFSRVYTSLKKPGKAAGLRKHCFSQYQGDHTPTQIECLQDGSV